MPTFGDGKAVENTDFGTPERNAAMKRLDAASREFKKFAGVLNIMPDLDAAVAEVINAMAQAFDVAILEQHAAEARVATLEKEVEAITFSRDHWLAEAQRKVDVFP